MRQFLIGALMILSGMAGSFVARAYLQQDTSHIFRYGKDLPEILHLVEQAYVDDVKMGELMPGAFQGAVEAVDESASYIPPGTKPEELERALFLRTGLVLTKRNGYPYILEAAAGSAPVAAGVKNAHYIRGLDGYSTRGKSLYQVQQALLKGNNFKLSLLTPGQADDVEVTVAIKPFKLAPLAAPVVRDGVQILAVPYNYPGLADDLSKALNALPDGATLVLDLRGSATADLELVKLLASHFLEAGPIGSWIDQKQRIPLENPSAGSFKHKLYLLQDHTTSGSAEILCAAARAQKRARLVGEPTIGLPFWYETLPLKHGGYLRLPTRQFAVGEQTVTGEGVQPHLRLDEKYRGVDAQEETLRAALELIKADDGRDDGLKKPHPGTEPETQN